MTRWTNADFGRAMVAYVEHHAQHARRRSDGITSEAFHRGGDNPESLRVWDARGTWADPRDPNPPTENGARSFAEHVAGVPLAEFMARWGNAPVRPAPPRAVDRGSVAADLERVWS